MEDEDKTNNFENHIKTALAVIITSVVIWIGASVQEATNSIMVLKTDVSIMKDTLKDYNDLLKDTTNIVVKHNEDIKLLNYKIERIDEN